MNRFLLLTVLLICALVPVSGNEPRELPKDLAYSDIKTGVVFPARLGKFHKTEIRINPNAVIGTVIRYEGDRIGCAAHVYIYSLSEKPQPISRGEFMEHWEKVRASILNPKNSRLDESESVRRLFCSRNKREYAMREIFDLRIKGGGTYHSELLLLPRGDQTVKLRVTVPKGEKDAVKEAEEFVRGFCRLFFPPEPPEFEPAAENETKP